MRRSIMASVMAAASMTITGAVQAGTSVAWVNPADGSVYPCGELVKPQGQATAAGTIGGAGLDLALVLDSSGSMGGWYNGKTLQQWQKDAAIALVDALPVNSTAVAVIEFDSDANTVKQLSPLTTDKAQIIAAINSVDASGGTTIGTGIDKARAELVGPNHTAGRSQMMVVMSDGYSSGSPGENADAAILAGVDQIHSVGLPGHDAVTMKRIVDGPNDVYNAGGDDHGIYTAFNNATDLAGIIGVFNGTAGSLVGIQKVEVTMPDGSTVVVPVSGVGTFEAPSDWAIQSGSQQWIATAYGTDGTSASATLTLNGVCQGVPDTSSTLPLLGLGLIGLFGLARRHSAR